MKPALAAVALVTTAALLSGCGGPPEDASKKEFCSQLKKINTEKTWSKTQQEVADFGDLGTPKGISKDARAGFLTLIENTKDAKDRATLVKKIQKLGKDDRKQLDAFDAYLTKTCSG